MQSQWLCFPVLSILTAALPACGLASDPGATGAANQAAPGDKANIGSIEQAISRSSSYWTLPYRGGGGGGPYSIACPRGNVAVGLYGRSGGYIDQGGLICAALYADGSLGPDSTIGSAGGGGGGPYYAVCPGGQALVG